jgi:hypothetical protein
MHLKGAALTSVKDTNRSLPEDRWMIEAAISAEYRDIRYRARSGSTAIGQNCRQSVDEPTVAFSPTLAQADVRAGRTNASFSTAEDGGHV